MVTASETVKGKEKKRNSVLVNILNYVPNIKEIFSKGIKNFGRRVFINTLKTSESKTEN